MSSDQNLTPTDFIEQIVFIDSQVEDYQTLAAGVVSGAKVIILDSNCDGIEQITSVLNRQTFSAIHIVSHGSPGCLYLGNSQLSLDTLDKYEQELKNWFSSLAFSTPLNKGGRGDRLLLYGCNVAAGDAGVEFIAKLNRLTGAEIAASTTPIGNVYLGGNWELDLTTKSISNNLVFTPKTQEAYAGVFATFTYNNTNSEATIDDGTITKTFNVTDNITIGDINIGLNLTHTYREALDITLTHPDGTTIELTTDNGGSNQNVYVLFDDEASTNITADNATHNTPGYTNLRIPEQALSAFDGKSSSGTWTLTITDDDAFGDVGTFNDAQLIIEEFVPEPLPWDVNPYNGGILVRGAAFISCGTLVNGTSDYVLAVERVDIDADGNPIVPTTNIEQEATNPLRWSHEDWTQEKIGNVYGLDVDLQGNMYAAASSNYGSGFFNQDANINYGCFINHRQT